MASTTAAAPLDSRLSKVAIPDSVATREVFTTGQIAAIFGVAPRTAQKWTDDGLMRGWRVPGSSYRRVTRGAVAEFIRNHAIVGVVLDVGRDGAQ